MTLILILHVLAAILLLGPLAVSTATFGRYAVAAHDGDAGSLGAAKVMYGISRNYGLASLLVPVLGIALVLSNLDEYLSNGLVHISITLAVVAWALLFFVVVPRQRTALDALGVVDADLDEGSAGAAKRQAKAQALDWSKVKGQLAMFSGVFSLLWFIIAVLMFFI